MITLLKEPTSKVVVHCNTNKETKQLNPLDHIKAVKQPIYPTSDNLGQAAQNLLDTIPLENRNSVYALLMQYQNTLLSSVELKEAA